MGLSRGAPLLGLLGAAAALLGACAAAGSSSSHSLRYFYAGVSEPGQGLPQFIAMTYVDDQLIDRYDIHTRRKTPVAPWMKKVDDYDAQFWDRNTQVLQNHEQMFRVSLMNLLKYYNQSGGFHTWQFMYGCELGKDWRRGGRSQFAYDGRDYISFDLETLTWTAADTQAQRTKRKWDANLANNQYKKNYYEKECIEWLHRYLDYGKETLLRTEPPKVKVTRKAGHDHTETLICRADGFYPKAIDMAWTRDGEVWVQDTFRGIVASNSDGTYHAWLGITVDPKERGRYQCRVGHDSLPKQVDLAWEEPASASNLGLIIGCVLGAILLVAAIAAVAGISVYIKKWRDGYRAASVRDQNSDNSSKA